MKTQESLTEFIRRGQQLNYGGSQETGCSEVSTTVDKDEPIGEISNQHQFTGLIIMKIKLRFQKN